MANGWMVLGIAVGAAVAGCTMAVAQEKAEPTLAERTVKVARAPMHAGRITNKLYGGFIELIDDLAPGMWAELLNDRGFEGVRPTNWFYTTGAPSMCDRQWESNAQASYVESEPYNGARSLRLSPRAGKPATVAQTVAVKKGMRYGFSGNFKGAEGVGLSISVKAELPDGSWMTLGSARLGKAGADWTKLKASFVSKGTTLNAVFELRASGNGTVAVDKVSLMPADNVKGWRADVVQVIKAAKMGVIRWGGSLQEYGYKWKSGIGDRDRRAPFYNQYWGRMETNDVGMEEFVQFCELVGAEPLVCTSFQDGVQSSRDIVEYLNGAADATWGKVRAANGHPDPYHVRYWQLGNEQWGDEYAKKVLEYCKAVKEADPDCVIVASDVSPLLLKTAGKYLDYVCRHHYSMGDIAGTEALLNEDRKTVDEAGLGRTLPMAITEWNITAGDWGLDRYKMITLQNAVNAGRFMNLLHRHSDFAEIGCRSNMTNCLGSGYIITNGLGVLLTPSYHALKVYADHYKPIPVAAKMAFAEIDLSACRSHDGSAMTVFAVNPLDKTVEVCLDLSEYPGFEVLGGEMMADRLDRHQPDVMNLWEAPDRVGVMPIRHAGDRVTLPAFTVVAIECGKRG